MDTGSFWLVCPLLAHKTNYSSTYTSARGFQTCSLIGRDSTVVVQKDPKFREPRIFSGGRTL